MTDKHKAQWNLEYIEPGGEDEGVYAWCSCIRGPALRDGGCKERLDSWEIERRLNATERLSAEDARVIGQVHEGKIEDILRAYANALEGK